jgi:photosystem II stability/assembly factor-like uncharacterized protein
MNDWWPKDLEDRVKALEENYGYITGTWPIVDYSYVQFEGSAVAEQLTERAIVLVSNSSAATSTTGYAGYGSFLPTGATTTDAVIQDYDNRVFLIDGDSLFTSDDGESYTEITNTDLGFKSGAYIKGIAKSNGVWVALGTPSNATFNEGLKVVQSTDLVTWTQVFSSLSYNLTSIPHQAVLDGNGNILVAYYNGSTGDNKALYSTDNGANWTETTNIFNGSNGRVIYARYTNNTWFMLGTRGYIYRSANITDWSVVWTEGSASNFINTMNVVYGDGVYVANQNGTGAKLLTSADGVSWVSQGAFASGNISSLHFDNTWKWAYVEGTNLYTSTNGITWSGIVSTLASMKGVISWDRPV